MINWTEIIIGICSILITGAIIPLVKAAIEKTKAEIEINFSKEEREIIYEMAESAVRWARQWLQSESGEKKKEEVMKFLSVQLSNIGIDVDADTLDKIVEGVYDKVKNE